MPSEITVRIAGTEILHDGRREALEELINLFREDGLDGEIAYRPPTGRGVTWWEVALIYIGMKAADAATGQVTKAVIDAVTGRAKQWAKGRLERGDTSRPQSITIFGPDGRPLKKVQIQKDGTEREEDVPDGDS